MSTGRLAHAGVTALVAWLVTGCTGRGASGAGQPRFTRRDLTIPMRDGVQLHAVALVPRDDATPVPILLIRTPFDASRELASTTLPLAYRSLAHDGYIFVAEDVRGRYHSGGKFVTTRGRTADDPRNTGTTDESTDTWDTIDWLVKHLARNNGRVGLIGVSYRGWLAAMGEIDPHPALKAVSPQAPVADAWMGDDFFHQGAFRETQGVAWAAWIEGNHPPTVPDGDQYQFYLGKGTLAAIGAATGVANEPSWIDFRNHPTYDQYWQSKALSHFLDKPTVPTLFVGGFWDAEDLYGAQYAYRAVERGDTAGINGMVLGPWTHGEWAQGVRDSVGPVALGNQPAVFFRDSIERPWFAYYLHGTGDIRFPGAWVYETGENQWHRFDHWPPAGVARRDLFLGADGEISFELPAIAHGGPAAADTTHTAAFDAFRSDPAHPVPYVPRPDDESGWATWMEEDQRFAADAGVLSWQTPPLTGDFTIAGPVVAHLFASTTGSDADWVVKLIDVFPDSAGSNGTGYQLMVNGDIMRGRYGNSFTQPAPIPANTVTRFDVDLHDQLYRFRRGHRIMIQIQSSWFPLYDRNPQTWVPNIFDARDGDFRAQTHRIWHTAQYPTHLRVETLP
ncbi:MAG: CocE/NonD family hydrolase [Gemmatimonadales bacterium]